MKKELLDKYNIPVPRYTSYPPANYFNSGYTEKEYREVLSISNTQKPQELSFYFHIPFCQHLCHYCGCNSIAAVNKELTSAYLEALHKEIDMVCAYISPERKISQIHYGGGTPTILDPEDIKALNDHLFSRFKTIENPEIAIECHPAFLNENGWIKLHEAGFNRFSLGIQDFNREVLKAVNRKPSLMKEEDIVALLHDKGAKVNMDFLYGLPFQTPNSFKETIERAVKLGPDRLVTFSYAHLPAIFPRQMILEKRGLPDTEQKSKMYEVAHNVLCDAGYKPVGMDHFVKPEDELYTALAQGKLHRNFQGYCTRRTTGQVYSFGITGISQLSGAYVQNTKNLSEYIDNINAGIMPVSKGYTLSKEEQITREVIDLLMCNYRINWNHISETLSVSINQIKAATAYSEEKMKEFAADGLIEYDENRIVMTQEGTLFVRNVAASLDNLMLNSKKSFSKPV